MSGTKEAKVKNTDWNKPHCESCGRQNPVTDEGYTSCCNENECIGGYRDKFGVPGNYKVACCWAKAEQMFGGMENVPENSSRMMSF